MFGWFAKWQKAEGLVVAKREVSRSSSGLSVTYEYVIEVRLADASTFRARVSEPFIATDFWSPDEGEVVGVEWDPESRKVRFDKSDERTSVRAHDRKRRQAEKNEFDAKLKGD